MACNKIPSTASCEDESLLNFKYFLDGYKVDMLGKNSLGYPCFEDVVLKTH